MKQWIWLLLLGCASAQADMLQALQAYQEEDYLQAQQHFVELLPLGNELAAFNLGVMALQGQGQPKDPTTALAYFTMAATLEHPQALTVRDQLSGQLDDAQRRAATAKSEQLLQLIEVTPFDLNEERNATGPIAIDRVAPKYPTRAQRQGLFGYVIVRVLINEQGEVVVADTVDAFPAGAFEKASIRAARSWRYQPSSSKQLQRIYFTFGLEGDSLNVSAVDQFEKRGQLLQYAAAGSPAHQTALGMLLYMTGAASENVLHFDETLPPTDALDFSLFAERHRPRPDFDDFWGRAVVRVDPNGKIVEQLYARFEAGSKVQDLLGLKLNGKIDSEIYRLSRSSKREMKAVDVATYLKVPLTYSPDFWWEQAAKNGSLEAQRIFGARDEGWNQYLLTQQNGEAMAWTGVKLVIEGQREEGMRLLEQAIQNNYKIATDMKRQLQ